LNSSASGRLEGSFLASCWKDCLEQSINRSLSLLERNQKAILLDCGCSEGNLTMKVAKRIGAREIYGIDLHEERCKRARKKGIDACTCDLNNKFPIKDSFFDVVFAHQVIEHLYDIDNFVSEIYRVLKPRGYAVVATENLSSWSNVFALILGYQDFAHHISTKQRIGNPLSSGYLKKVKPGGSASSLKGLTHVKILTPRSLKEIFIIHGYVIEKIVGAGYPPIKGKISSVLSRLDPSHSNFIIAKARKQNLNGRTEQS
jgi:SAM-dependent methyltransferase